MTNFVTIESSGLYSIKSDLKMKVKKEDKDAKFYCEVVYFVPGATKMTESSRIDINVYCEFHKLKRDWPASNAPVHPKLMLDGKFF